MTVTVSVDGVDLAVVLDVVLSELREVDGQIDAAQLELEALRARRRQLRLDRAELEAFLAYRAAHP